MAKTYVNTAKYLITEDFEIDGIVDKPDIIGAIFGQSEGLLGEEMDLKELQRNGKIGRIEITTKSAMGKTKGTLTVPSSMDMAETSMLAATIETVDKVGPCAAKFEIKGLDDVRSAKRDAIALRAKDLLKNLMSTQMPDSTQMAESVRENARAADIRSYGKDKIPCGPDIERQQELIIVEGRADVLNLLKNNINNVVGMNGSNISQDIVKLCKGKEVTAFVDGDRGGELNARKLQQMVKVDFVAVAPDGKEVEELTRKEIILSLRRKDSKPMRSDYKRVERPYGERSYSRPRTPGTRAPYSGSGDSRPYSGSRDSRPYSDSGDRTPYSGPRDSRPYSGFRDSGPRAPFGRSALRPPFERRAPRVPAFSDSQEGSAFGGRNPFEDEVGEKFKELKPSIEEREMFSPILKTVNGKLKAKLFDKKMKELKEVPVRSLVKALGEAKGVNSVVFDGIITKRLIEAADKNKVEYLVGMKRAKVENGKVKAITIAA
ncbi:MAG: DNA primase DnaG [Candidatus Diapherotrites archaeon]